MRFRVRFRVQAGNVLGLVAAARLRAQEFIGETDAWEFEIMEIDATPLVESEQGGVTTWEANVEVRVDPR